MKLLIVDDETILHQRIQHAVEEADLGFHEIYTAENAFDAIRIIDEQHPEIVITDIRMPSKSGLEIAEHVYTHYPKTPVILVTGYSDFEYARTAIQNHVFEYLLKPIESEKLISVLLRAQKQIETDEKHERLFSVFKAHFADNLDSIRRQYIESLLFRTGAALDADEHRGVYHLNFEKYRLIAIHCTTAMESAKLESEYYCTHLVEQYIQEAYKNCVTYVFGELVFMVWEVTKPDTYDDNEALLGFLRDLHAYVRRNFLGMLSAGISQISETLTNIQILRHQTMECLEYMQEQGKREFILYEDILNTDAARWEIESCVDALISDIHAGNKETAAKTTACILQDVLENQPEYFSSTCLLILSGVTFILHEYKQDAAALTNPLMQSLAQEDTAKTTEYLTACVNRAGDVISAAHRDRTNALVGSIREYISQHYCEPIGLAEASRYVGRNPSYISRLIREHTGVSFTQLLTDKRMQEAKHLLKETNLKVSEISDRIGYANVRYFTRVFKTVMHMSANDYRSFSAAFE